MLLALNYIMKVKIEDGKNCQKLIKIEVESQKVKDALDDIYKSIGKDAQIPGFRRGKAPQNIIEARYKETANSEAVRRLIWEAYLDAIKANDIKPLSYPIIEDVKFDKDTPLNFTVKIDVKPVINLEPYTKIKIKKISEEVNKEDINKALEAVRELTAKTESDGKKVLPPLDDELAKQVGNFKNLGELEERLKKELALKKKQQQRSDMENQLFDFLLKTNQFDVPESAVQRQLQNLLNDATLHMAYQGYKKEEIESQVDKLKETLTTNATRQAKIFFILEAIAEKENIDVTDEELNRNIDEMSRVVKSLASAQDGSRDGEPLDVARDGSKSGEFVEPTVEPQEAEKFKENLEKKNLMDSMRQQLSHDKVIEFLLKESRIVEN